MALVAALHVALLSAVDPPHDAGPRGAAPLRHAPSALQTRLLLPPRSGATPAPAIATRPTPAAVAPTGRPRAAAPAVPRPVAADTAPQPVAAAPLGDIPVYATQPPPAFAYSYVLQRGEERGSLELRWRPEGDRYEASLAGSLEGAPLFALHSVGAFDAAGLAPLRHTDAAEGAVRRRRTFAATRAASPFPARRASGRWPPACRTG